MNKIPNNQRIVIKIGGSILLDEAGNVSPTKIDNIAKQVKSVRDKEKEVIIVSSGAVACGMQMLGLKKKPKVMPERQAIASVGQVLLMKLYTESFSKLSINVGQILLTHEDIKSRKRCLNLMNTINSLLSKKVLPIVNENDALSFEEIMFGDNDNLSALIAQITNAHLLLILSDVDGLFEQDPKEFPNAKMLSLVEEIDEKIESMAGGTISGKSTGGMTSKIQAAKKATYYGIPTRIVRGDAENIIWRAINGEKVGTLFLPDKKFSRKKCWIAFAFRPHGAVWIDKGAEIALLKREGKSLLPSGIVKVEGDFTRGECVNLLNVQSQLIARGITNYSSSDIIRIKGIKSSGIEEKIGYKYTDEVVHKENIVVLV